MRIHPLTTGAVLAFGYLVLPPGAWAATSAASRAASVLAQTGIQGGFCAHLGHDADLATELHGGGHVLVQDLALDDAALDQVRQKAVAKGVYGLVTSTRPARWDRLPYADNGVNLLVVDKLSDLTSKGLPLSELRRVVAPYGAARIGLDPDSADRQSQSLRQAGFTALSITTDNGGPTALYKRAADPNMDGWTHYCHGPDGNALSHDKTIKPQNCVKWKAEGSYFGKLAGISLGSFVSANGRTFYYNQWEDANGRYAELVARDAFTGAQLWKKSTTLGGARIQNQFVADGDVLYALLSGKGPYVAIDGATGNILRSFTASGWTEETGNLWITSILKVGDKLLQSYKNKLYCLDPSTGAIAWTHEVAANQYITQLSASAEAGKAFYALATTPDNGPSRWTTIRWQNVVSVVAVDLATGKAVWTNTDEGKHSIGQIVYYKGYLGIFGNGSAWDSTAWNDKHLAALDAATGKRLWFSSYTADWNIQGYHIILRDSDYIYFDPWRVHVMDLKTGAHRRTYGSNLNNRCVRNVASDDYVLFGFNFFLDKDWKYAQPQSKRSACATPPNPAFGNSYYTPNGCGCLGAQVPGVVAMSNTGDTWVANPPTGAWQPNVENEPAGRPTTGIRRPVLHKSSGVSAPQGPITADWPAPRPLLAKASAKLTGGYQFQVQAGGSLVDVSKDGAYLYSLPLAGPISGDPVVSQGKIILGSRDGWVYGFDAATGAQAWRTLVAPGERYILNASRAESPWPVERVALQDSVIAATTYANPALGAGAATYGLRPADGSVAWTLRPAQAAPAISLGAFAAAGETVDPAPGQAPAARVNPHRPARKLYDLSGRRVPAGAVRLPEASGIRVPDTRAPAAAD